MAPSIWVVVVLFHIVMYFCFSKFKRNSSVWVTGPKMALLIYTEMAWVIVSPSYLCSHTDKGNLTDLYEGNNYHLSI